MVHKSTSGSAFSSAAFITLAGLCSTATMSTSGVDPSACLFVLLGDCTVEPVASVSPLSGDLTAVWDADPTPEAVGVVAADEL